MIVCTFITVLALDEPMRWLDLPAIKPFFFLSHVRSVPQDDTILTQSMNTNSEKIMYLRINDFDDASANTQI